MSKEIELRAFKQGKAAPKGKKNPYVKRPKYRAQFQRGYRLTHGENAPE